MRRLFYFYIIPKFCSNNETNKYKYFIFIINKIIKIIRRSYIHIYIDTYIRNVTMFTTTLYCRSEQKMQQS